MSSSLLLRRVLARAPQATLQRAQMFTSTRARQEFPQITRAVFANAARAISTSAPLTNAATPAAPATAAPTSLSSIVAKYGGWYPLVGLGGFLAVSKELLILNEEFLMVSNFAAMVFISWLMVGDTITSSVNEQRAAIAKKNDEASDLYIDSIQALITAHELNIAHVEVLKALKAEFSTLVGQVVEAKDLKARQAARDAVLARLNALKQREETEKASYLVAVYDKTLEHALRSAGKLDAASKNALIDNAIDIVAGKPSTLDAKNDPIVKIFRDYLDSRAFEREIEQDRVEREQRLARSRA